MNINIGDQLLMRDRSVVQVISVEDGVFSGKDVLGEGEGVDYFTVDAVRKNLNTGEEAEPAKVNVPDLDKPEDEQK